MPRTTRSGASRLAGLLFAAVLTATAATGCGSGGDPVSSEARPAPSKQAEGGRASQKASLNSAELEAALPNQLSVPADLDEPRTRKAWDTPDATNCQAEVWPDPWCAKAVAVGLAGFWNLGDQLLTIRLISFPDSDTAAQLFEGEGTPDEVGENPSGDEIDGFEIEGSKQMGTWSGKGINVREGSVTAKIEYTWAEGTVIPAERMQKLVNMVVQRIQQVQNGESPTASAR